MNLQRIVPFLWFDTHAQEAAKYYTSIFKNSKVTHLSPLVSTFELDGQKFMAINGGPQFKFTEAISFYVNCESQEEVDYFWTALSNDGATSQCGWLKDKYGMSWQVIPTILQEHMSDKDPAKTKRVFDAIMKMTKIDIKKLEDAYNGK